MAEITRLEQIQARLTEGADALHAYGRTLYDNHYEQIVLTMREAEAELSRLSHELETATQKLDGAHLQVCAFCKAREAENQRLSRVEQALREVLEWCDGMIDEIRECHDSEEVWKYVVQNPRFGELNKSVKSVLSASPEAKPEEER